MIEGTIVNGWWWILKRSLLLLFKFLTLHVLVNFCFENYMMLANLVYAWVLRSDDNLSFSSDLL